MTLYRCPYCREQFSNHEPNIVKDIYGRSVFPGSLNNSMEKLADEYSPISRKDIEAFKKWEFEHQARIETRKENAAEIAALERRIEELETKMGLRQDSR
jgi:hypothetical protein